MAIKFFGKRTQAEIYKRAMRGWRTKIIKTSLGYVIMCNATKYVCIDGFIR